jgi:hypothetical protein
MHCEFKLAAIECRQFKITRCFQSLFGTGIDALGAVDAFGEVYLALKFAVGRLDYVDSV